jgi:iron complex outermembrane receptor protein
MLTSSIYKFSPSKKHFMIIGVFFLFLVLSLPINGKILDGKIRGIVVDNESNQPIPGVTILFKEINRYLITDMKGEFFITFEQDLKSIKLEVSHLGYRENHLKVEIESALEEKIIIYMIPKSIEIDPVLVSDYKSYSKFDDLQELTNVLKGKDLQKELGLTLASTLKNETGLAIRSMGPAPARPVIRGLSSDRVFISEDGNKTTDLSATSPDHAVSVDPFNLQRIEVLRGPKTLTQTPTTIGGVVNVVRGEIPTIWHDHILGSIGGYGETANGGYLGSAMVEVPVNRFSIRGEISRRRSFNVNTPAGKLENSYSKNQNYSLGSSYISDHFMIGGSFRRFEIDYGVPGGFVGAHPKGVDITMFRRQFNLKSEFHFHNSFVSDIKINLSRVLYRHSEFEASGAIGSEFRVDNTLGHIHIEHENLGLLRRGIWGLSFEHRDFDIGGLVFTSPAKSINLSAFVYETFVSGRFSFELGARYNFDSIDPARKEIDDKIGEIKKRTFNTYSLSISTLYELTKNVSAGFNISKSSRTPTIEELYSRGPHLAAYSYEIGNPTLEDERGIGTELFVYNKFENLFWNLNLFRNDLSYYIIPRNTGEINFQTFLPVYQTYGIAALLYGAEFQLDWDITSRVKVSTNVSYTRGNFKGTNNSLPQIPPLKGKLEVNHNFLDILFGLNAEWATAQRNVDEFEEPTSGYIIYNWYGQYSISSDAVIHNFSLNIDNILDTEYRNHLSRVKSILPEAGRNFRFTYKLFFNM